MDEYLRRQRASAEQHITQMQSGDQVVHLGGNEGMISLQVEHIGSFISTLVSEGLGQLTIALSYQPQKMASFIKTLLMLALIKTDT